MEFARIPAPHYYAGHMAALGPWKKLSPNRMSYLAGYRWYRNGITARGSHPLYQFK